jgi:hypothetical protein
VRRRARSRPARDGRRRNTSPRGRDLRGTRGGPHRAPSVVPRALREAASPRSRRAFSRRMSVKGPEAALPPRAALFFSSSYVSSLISRWALSRRCLE